MVLLLQPADIGYPGEVSQGTDATPYLRGLGFCDISNSLAKRRWMETNKRVHHAIVFARDASGPSEGSAHGTNG